MIMRGLQICQILISIFRYVKNIFGDTKEVADWDNGGIQAKKNNSYEIPFLERPINMKFSSSGLGETMTTTASLTRFKFEDLCRRKRFEFANRPSCARG